MAQTGWKKGILLVGAGCLSVVVLLVVMVGIGLVWATSTARSLGDPTPEPVARTIAITGGVSGAAGAGVQADAPDANAAHRLDIELQDGRFTVRPGPPGGDVTVDGAYATSYYELIEEHRTADAPGGPSTLIRLRPTQSLLVRMIATLRTGADSARQPNDLTVVIPAGLSIALTLRLNQGESRIDLGGLTLTDLEVDLSTGDHELDFSQPLAAELGRLALNGRMGNVAVENLGNARALEIDASSSMGNFTADLGGPWRRATVSEVSFDHSMGELRLSIPTAVRIAADSDSSVFLGESSEPGGGGETNDPAAPVLRLNLSTTMGETRISRY